MKDENFDEYMENFKKLPIKEKQAISIEQLKMIAGLLKKMCDEKKIDSDIFINREVVDINNHNYTEDDYVEALMVYINSIQNLICDYAIGE